MPNTKRNFRKRMKGKGREKESVGEIGREEERGVGEKDEVCSK